MSKPGAGDAGTTPALSRRPLRVTGSPATLPEALELEPPPFDEIPVEYQAEFALEYGTGW